MEKYICKRCNREFDEYHSLSRHVSRIHKVKPVDFRVEYFLNGVWPLCKCGCGVKVKWSPQLKQFCDYRRGHASKINNNWGHNKEARIKSQETRRQMIDSGEFVIWNKGLTKDTSESVKLNAKNSKITKNFPDNIKRSSIHMKKSWIDGKLIARMGNKSPNWKGGKSQFQARSRADNRLYQEWKYPILQKSNFKCEKCQSTKELQIHHDKETFSEILDIIIKNEDITTFSEELTQLKIKEVTDYHINNSISGVCLCRKCHKELHPSLNF